MCKPTTPLAHAIVEHPVGAVPPVSELPKQLPTKESYVFEEPPPLNASEHFSSLLTSGEWFATAMEASLLFGLLAISTAFPSLDVAGSMPLQHVALFFIACSMFRKLYNAYLETVYFSCPALRTQPPSEHALKGSIKDLCGRELHQLETINFHDKLTMVSQISLELLFYFSIPGFYPAPSEVAQPLVLRAFKLLLNHYVLSFGMYWMHRALHVVPFFWRHIHSFHHWARHPLSRNTYEDHWLDNFANAIIGHGFAQILIPLDYPTFIFSRVLRIMESLEKHSGVSCNLNLAHAVQRWLPFAQMPHHHDWHHEGHKGCNFTFASVGGIWDCLFGTRKAGRGNEPQCAPAQTREDRANPSNKCTKSWLDTPVVVFSPVLAVALAVALKLQRVDILK